MKHFKRLLLVILLFVVFLNGSLLFAESTSPSGKTSTMKEISRLPFLGQDTYFGMYMVKQKIGWQHVVLKKEKGNYVYLEEAEIKQNIGGNTVSMKTATRTTYDNNGKISIIDFTSESPVGKNRLRGIVTGKTMSITSFIGSHMTSDNISAPQINLKDKLAVSVDIVNKRVKIGSEYHSLTYDPSIKKVVKIVEKIVGMETRMLNGIEEKVYLVEGGMPELGIKMSAVYNAQGVPLETNVAGAMQLKLEDKEQALNSSATANLVLNTIIKLDKKLPDDKPLKLSLKVKGIEENLLVNNERQKWSKLEDGYGLKITQESFDPKNAVFVDSAKKAEMAEYLEKEPDIQTDDPEIIKRAGQLKKGVKNSFELAQKIMKWVYDKMNKSYTPTWSNASEAIRTMQGDCGEHAVLFVALARAAGLPAREVVGVMYLDDIQGFGFHAWAEVWLGKWVSVDPTWNQFPTFADHIVMATGGASEQIKVVSAFGNIAIEQN